MKKNFKPLVLLAATVLSVGLTSCIDNEVAPEVKSIYEKQAQWIGSKSELSLAQARYQDAQSEYQKQQTENLKLEAQLTELNIRLKKVDVEIAEATKAGTVQSKLNELEKKRLDFEAKKVGIEADLINNKTRLAQAKQKAEIAEIGLAFGLVKAKVENSSGLFTDYAAAQQKVINATSDLNDEKQKLITYNKELAIYASFEEGKHVENAEKEVSSKEKALKAAKSKYEKAKGKYDGLVAKKKNQPLLVAKKGLESDKKKIDDSVKVLKAEKNKLETKAQRDFGQFAKLNNARTQYSAALADLATKQESMDNEAATNVDNKKILQDLGLSGKSVAELKANKNAKNTELTNAEATKDSIELAYNNLNANFKTALDAYAEAKRGSVENTRDINEAKKELEQAEKAYEIAKENFEKHPNGTPRDGGVDNKAGDHSDDNTNSATLYKLVWDGKAYIFTGEPIVGKDVATLESDPEYAGGIETDWAKVEAAANAGDGDTYAGKYFDVEGNDVTGTESYKEILAKAEVEVKRWKDKVADLTSNNVAVNVKEAEKKYNEAHELLLKGKEKLDVATANYNKAKDAATAATNALNAAEGIVEYENKLKKNNFELAELQAKVTAKKEEVTALEAKVSDESLKAYEDLQKSIQDIQAKIEGLGIDSQAKQDLITYYTELIDANGIDVARWDDMIANARERMNTAKANVGTAQEALNAAKAALEQAKVGGPFDIEVRKAELNQKINDSKAKIARFEEIVENLKEVAAKRKSLYEESVKAKA